MEDRISLKLRVCSSFIELKRIHARIMVSSLSQSSFLATQIVNTCNVCARIDYAAKVFDQVRDPNIFLFNAMTKAYAQNNHFREAIGLYKHMLGDRFTYPFVLKSCAGLPQLQLGEQIHTQVVKSGLDSEDVVQNSLLEMYTKVDELITAHKVFDEMTERDSVSWNTIITAHARLGQMREARALFDSMPNRTVVSWTALISGYSFVGCFSDAVEMFHQMQVEGFEPDDISIVSVLPACVQLGALELGKWIHAYADKHGLLKKTFICNALIELHSKCGSIDQALQIFDEMPQRDVISWSTMIGGLAMNSRAREAVKLFQFMENQSRTKPNGVTFLGLLAACAHAGLVDEGLHYFNSMKNIHGIEPGLKHYGCIVDLLGRMGYIDQAVEVIEGMPIPADAAIWGSLLSSCRSRGNVETAVRAMDELVKLEPDEMGNLLLLSGIYAKEKRWADVATMRRFMRSRRLTKTPACSLVEVDNGVHEFTAGDDSNPRSTEMAEMLRLLRSEEHEEEIGSKK
ncbi:Pentatricopeptide repeat-containing protein [Apostasia shenzhenica]|uniref:Pentatricopeptide repeat-containing protein n=1 Tax=Apostasia shenzhenica TaxID=1088818 RepID=A0A2I0BG64_9ASPA|nr:Pentatricopeptide repeat-containing protein [Apostasia shenzhenica]